MSEPTASQRVDVAIVGAGAAGLMAAIAAGRTLAARSNRGRSADHDRIVLFDGSARLGMKILIAGGGRCNVTHHAVSERDYAGATAPSIRKVLRRFTVEDTVRFFEELGVRLKREPTGKLFPVADDARVVLEALLGAVRDAGADLRHPCRVRGIARAGTSDGPPAKTGHGTGAGKPPAFRLDTDAGPISAQQVILATGGLSMPKTGSDGAGHAFARSLGHSITPLVTPSLVPLRLEDGHWIRDLSGIAVEAELRLRRAGGKVLHRVRGSVLCTHFGLSGPCTLDMSRHWIHARDADPDTRLELSWLPDTDADSIDASLRELGRRGVLAWLRERLPERIARALLERTGAEPGRPIHQWPRAMRRGLAEALAGTPLPILGDRGYAYAEVTAGGVPLSEIDLATMESRLVPGLFLCGEILDVDGRIGGFNFQWAWASGHVAGTSAIGS